MTIHNNFALFSAAILAFTLFFAACSDDSSSAPEEKSSHEEETSHEEHHGHHMEEPSAGDLTLGDEDIQDGFIFLQDTTINGVLTVSTTTPGATVLKNVKVTGNLLIKRSGRVDFSGSADVVHVGSSNTDVYAFEDEA